MGGVDDCGSPPSKRLKLLAHIFAEEPSPSLLSYNPSMARSIYHTDSFSSSSSSLKSSSLSSSSSSSLLPSVHPKIEETFLGSNGLIRKTESVTMVTQSLYSLGYCKSTSLLEQEFHQLEHIQQCCLVLEPYC